VLPRKRKGGKKHSNESLQDARARGEQTRLFKRKGGKGGREAYDLGELGEHSCKSIKKGGKEGTMRGLWGEEKREDSF